MKDTFGAQVKALFNACSELTAAARAAHIADSSYPQAVKQQVLRLLAYSGDIDEKLSQVIADTAQQSLHLTQIEPGQQVDQYRLIKSIGEGGQGEVWMAERDDGEFSHQVAIKFLKISANEYELSRFQTERELLASLQHPNIAGLLGGGQFKDRLYMIMEWIDGLPLMDDIEQKQLSLVDTLDCFLQICQAVSYAHAKGIIHRDIKPSNILITGSGVVKLLDFGVAKSIDAENTQTNSAAMMTLAYSSPEQINGQPVTTATDVYALGLVLYEMLTVRKAQQHTTESPAEYLHLISEVTPDKPSLLAARGHVSRFSARALQGDLDNLVMMAIRKEPERRYNTADALITDVNNFLKSRPLLASGDSLTYRMSKLVKRNPLAAVLGVLVVVFLVVLPILMYQHGLRLKQERDIAQEQTLVANKTTEFLTTLFESVSPLGSEGQSVSLDSVLAQAERQLSENLTQQPKVLASLSMVMGGIQHHMDNTPKSIEYYHKAAALLHDEGDWEAELVARGQLALMYFRNDDLPNTDAQMVQADALAEQVEDEVQVAWHLLRKATVAGERGQSEQAAVWAQQALALLDDEQRQNAALMGRIYSEWGEAVKHTDKTLSLELNGQSLVYAEKETGKIHPFYLGRLSSRAMRLMRLNRHEEAVVIIDETIDIARRLYSESHPKYASFLTSKLTYLHDKGYFAEAEQLYLQVKNIFLHSYGENHFEYARVINNLAYLYEDRGKLQQALPLYQRSVELRKQLDPDNAMRIANAQANLARVLAKTHQHALSDQLVQSVMPVFAASKRNNLYNEIIVLANLFKDGSDVNSCAQGVTRLAELKPQLEQESNKSWRRLGAELWIARMLQSCDLQKQAQMWFNTAHAMSKQIYKPDSEGFAMIEQSLESVSQAE